MAADTHIEAALSFPRLTRIARAYLRFMEILAIALMTSLTVVAGLQVFFRYVVGASLFWSDELSRYLMIWSAFLLGGMAYSKGELLGMRLLVDALPPRVRQVVDGIGRGLILILLLVTAWYGVDFAIRTTAMEATALQVSMFWIHLAVPIGCAILSLHVLAGFFALAPAPEDEAHNQ